MSNIQYYKGYTLHQINSNPGSDDGDNTAVRRMELISGLYVHKPFGQEGISLPVCKYINNRTYRPVHEFDVDADMIGAHPRYGYAKIEEDRIVLSNSVIIPKYILGGMIVLNNLMLSHKGKDVLTEGNLIPLIASKHISVLREYKEGNELVGIVISVNKDCILETKLLRLVFKFNSDENDYMDLNTATYMK